MEEDLVVNHILVKEGNHQELRLMLIFINKFGSQIENQDDEEGM